MSKISISTIYHKLFELDRSTDDRSRMLTANPYADRNESVYQIAGECDGNVVGGVNVFPLRIIADDMELVVSGVGGLWVGEEYRSTGYGLDLYEEMRNISTDKILVGYGLSQKARRMARIMGAAVFDVARFGFVKKSAYFLETYLSRYNNFFVRFMLNIAGNIHSLIVCFIAWIASYKYKIEDVAVGDAKSIKAFADMIAADTHRFRQDESAEYLKWMLLNDFGPVDDADKRLYSITKAGNHVGYVVTRRSKERRLGCIIDWQFAQEIDVVSPWLMIRVAHKLLATTEAVVLAASVNDTKLISVWKKVLPKFPGQVAEIATGTKSPLESHEGWREQSNWRIRPCMGDGAFY